MRFAAGPRSRAAGRAGSTLRRPRRLNASSAAPAQRFVGRAGSTLRRPRRLNASSAAPAQRFVGSGGSPAVVAARAQSTNSPS
ncbi:hypothetical protein BGI47_30975 [Burkholderia pseudomallei]|nr:hypothetical protein BGI47_30975 [Burkholderia pseudomallei]APZ29139.1 hypothetical protein BGI46_30965 [Burkholderia pseudomallei]